MDAEVHAIESQFRNNVIEGANGLPELLSLCEGSLRNAGRCEQALAALARCFKTAFQSPLFAASTASDVASVKSVKHATKSAGIVALDSQDEKAKAEAVFVQWAAQQLAKFFQLATNVMERSDNDILRANAMMCLYDVLEQQARTRKRIGAKLSTDSALVEKVVHSLFVDASAIRHLPDELLEAFVRSFGRKQDLLSSVWGAVSKLLQEHASRDVATRAKLASQVVVLLLAAGPPLEQFEVLNMADDELTEKGIRRAIRSHQKQFSRAWSGVLVSPLTEQTYKMILQRLEGEVMPHLTHPVMLVDFCFAAYRMGGYCALLSLRSLFSISVKLNVEVPDFFTKMYALLTPQAFVQKKRNELFELLDRSLTSEYVPLSVVAAFAKRLCRLALRAPAYGSLICLQLVFNILKRHPNTMVLIHYVKNEEEEEGNSDDEGGAPTKSRKRWLRAEAIDRRHLKKGKEDGDGQDDEGGAQDAGLVDDEDEFVLEVEGAVAKRDDDEKAAALAQDDNVEVVFEGDAPDAANVAAAGDEDDAPTSVRNVANDESAALVTEDPFLEDESDPGKARALESSLWEIMALQNHFVPEVANAAKIFSGNMEIPLFDIERVSERSYKDVIDKLRRKKAKETPLEHRKKPNLIPSELANLWLE